MSTPPPECYQPAEGLLLRTWPGEDVAAAFAPGRGSTHLVSTLAAEVLRELTEASPATPEALVQRLWDGEAPDHDDARREALDTVGAALQALLQAGLIRRAESAA